MLATAAISPPVTRQFRFCERLRLAAISSEQVEAVEAMKAETLRVKFDEQLRSQKRKESSIAVEGKPATGLRPWRDIVMPHPDVASGRHRRILTRRAKNQELVARFPGGLRARG